MSSDDILRVEVNDLNFNERQYGFYFTDSNLVNTILRDGLSVKGGAADKSKKEAIPKMTFALGLEGVLQNCNRTLNSKLDLSIQKSFESAKEYFAKNSFVIFEAPKTEYEKNITEEQLESLNRKIKTSSDYSLVGNLKNMKNNMQSNSVEMSIKQVSKMIRQDTVFAVNALRGEETKKGLYDEIDYNEETFKWEKQTPNNVHTRIVTDKDGVHGLRVLSDNIRLLSAGGKTDALSVIKALVNNRNKYKSYVLENEGKKDIDLLDAFAAYMQLPEDMTQEELNTFFATVKRLANSEQGYPRNDKISDVQNVTDKIVSSRESTEGKLTMEKITSNALSNLDSGLVPIEDYVISVDREEREILKKAEELKSKGINLFDED